MKNLINNNTITAVSILTIFMFAFSPKTADAEQKFVSIGTGGVTGVYYPTGGAICRLVNKTRKTHGIRCSAESTGGSVYNINTIRAGELEFGVAQSDWQYHAVNGSSKWEGKKFANLRAVFSVHPEPFQLIASGSSGINSWGDLKGKVVNVGNPGSGQRGTMEVLMNAMGVDNSYFKGVTELTSSEQVKALCDGKIDAYGYSVGFPNGAMEQAATCAAKALPINLTGGPVQGLIDGAPYYAAATIPAGTYTGQKKDVTTFGVKATVVTSADVSEELVYLVTKAVFENFDDFRKQHPAFGPLEKKNMIADGLSAPLHPGAVKYYKEAGLM